VREHGDILWRFALSRLRRPQLAEEVVQEALLSAIQSFHRFNGESSERTWLLGITAHKIADCLRRERREERTRSSGGSTEPLADDPFTKRGKWKRIPRLWPSRESAHGAAGSDALEHAELLRALTTCLEKLPPGIAEAIWLRDLLEMPAEEVCQALGLSATNLWTRTHRGRLALRSCIESTLGATDSHPGGAARGESHS
jgi:RNA polymerase sigma-70 factor (TIGR02943 family)